MKILLVTLSLIIIAGICYLQTPKFGRLPRGKELEAIKLSPNYKNGRFQNLVPTPQMSGENGFLSVMADYLFGKHPNTKPSYPLPSIKTDLKKIAPDKNVLIWFGHSSYFIQLNGIRLLVDPVLSRTASPVPGNVVSFDGTDIYRPEDIPELDYVIITHDHWDHLDYPTMKKLKAKTKKVVTGLGVGAHLRHWGFTEAQIVEMDWNNKFSAENHEIHCLPARHFSGRGLTANKSLWASFLLKFPDFKLYIGGDSGYGEHYKNIGSQFGQIDLALLDSGQYDQNWKYIHETPEQVIQAAKDLNAAALLPVHNSRFTISNHPWNEPLERIRELGRDENFRILTPIIGEEIELDNPRQTFRPWWKDTPAALPKR